MRLSTEGHCMSYCSHGGICTGEDEHDGLHDSGYCQWTDAEAISYQEAQDRLSAQSAQGRMLAFEWDLMIGEPD